VVAQGNLRWLSLAGLAVVAQGAVEGISVSGLAVVGERAVRGLAATLGAVESGSAIAGAVFGGYRIRAPEVRGLAISVAQLRTTDFSGFGTGAYTEVRGVQRGLTIAIYNHARELHGLQVGIINRADNNRGAARILPIINFHR